MDDPEPEHRLIERAPLRHRWSWRSAEVRVLDTPSTREIGVSRLLESCGFLGSTAADHVYSTRPKFLPQQA